jgi:hypothetical protein
MDQVGRPVAHRGRRVGSRAPGNLTVGRYAVVLLAAGLVSGTLSAFTATTGDAGNNLTGAQVGEHYAAGR